MEKRPIADLHCDLLCYLAGQDQRSAYDKAVRCSIPQLLAGNVFIQTLAVFTPTAPGSSNRGMKQVEIFRRLPQMYPDAFEIIKDAYQLYVSSRNGRIGIMLAFENGSSFCDEKEDLEKALGRLETIEKKSGKIVYISLTWNDENRFGGGSLSNNGLKKDGKGLLDFLNHKSIAVDLSHASDALARDIFDYIDQNNLDIPVIASHSNSRAVENMERNLPDDIAKEILRRGGVIGINFVKQLVGGDDPKNFAYHIKHMIDLGGKNQLCFGADFFYNKDLPATHALYGQEMFFPSLDNASSYSHVLQCGKQHALLDEESLDNLAFSNLQKFLKEKIYSR